MDNNISVQDIQIVQEQQRFMVKVYGWMAFALATTGIVATSVASSQSMLEMIIGNKMIFFGLFIVQILMVGALSIWAQKLSSLAVMALFVAYAALTGLTFSFIFLIYTSESIASTFFITAGTFAVMSFFGLFTGTDLTKFGSIMMMGLIGLVIASLVNMFMQNETLYWITTYAGVLIFTGLIAYDTQRIKDMHLAGADGTEEGKKLAVMGALKLYLDFINLFLMLLRLFGRRK